VSCLLEGTVYSQRTYCLAQKITDVKAVYVDHGQAAADQRRGYRTRNVSSATSRVFTDDGLTGFCQRGAAALVEHSWR
jgi:hypothetical protein